MTPAEEDALAEKVRHIGITEGGDPVRLAIRAAVAQERERAANCCVDLSACVMPHAKDYFIECAAAIRRG